MIVSQNQRTPLHPILKNKPGVFLVPLIVVLLGAVLAAYFILPKGERINTNGYQVVYMATGQAYFGQLQNTGGEYLRLKTPYSAQDVSASDSENGDTQSSTTLIKVSQQQYGPEDMMSLKSDQVLFWQNLRDDSKVVQAIKSSN